MIVVYKHNYYRLWLDIKQTIYSTWFANRLEKNTKLLLRTAVESPRGVYNIKNELCANYFKGW